MQQKIGAGHAEAMARLGLKELRNALNPSKESVADSEIGLYGTATQGEIAEARDFREEGAGKSAALDNQVGNETATPSRDDGQAGREDSQSRGR